jgi:hypothetical protein
LARSTADRILAAAVLLAVAAPAAAHGEEALFAPIGNFVALALVTVSAFRVRALHWAWRAFAMFLAVLACLPPYFVTNMYVPYWLAFSGLAWFAVGLVPPLALAGVLLFWRSRATRPKPA